MKIVMYVENFIAGGLDTVLANKINAWSLEDEIILMCNQTNDGLSKILKKRITRPYQFIASNILSVNDIISHKYIKIFPRIFFAAFFYYAKYFLGLYNLMSIYFKLKGRSIDAIFIHNGGYPAADSARFVVMSAKLASIKHIFMVVHSVAAPLKIFNRPFEYILDRVVEKHCKMICVSEKSRESLLSRRALRNEAHVIYNGMSFIEKKIVDKAINNQMLDLKQSHHIIAIIGWFDAIKGHDDLFASIALLKNIHEVQNIKCLVFGQGHNVQSENRIAELIKHHRISENVCLMGFRPDVIEYLRYVDILVVPSRQYEGFSMAALEAISQGVPTIISDICGIAELLTDRVSTYIVPSARPDALALTLKEMLNDTNIRASVSQSAKEKFGDVLDAKTMSLAYRKLLISAA